EILLIEPESCGQVVVGIDPALAQCLQSIVKRIRQSRAKQRSFLRVREGTVPINMGLIRLEQTAFEEPLQLVLHTDFFIGNRPAARSAQRRSNGGRWKLPCDSGQAVCTIRQVAAEDFI